MIQNEKTRKKNPQRPKPTKTGRHATAAAPTAAVKLGNVVNCHFHLSLPAK
jgi:hypothetical protein